MRSPRLRLALPIAVLAVGGVIAYSLIAHVMTVDDDRSLGGYLFAIGSVAALVLMLAWPGRWRWPVALLTAVAALGAFELRHVVAWDPRWLYLAQHAGIHAALGVAFGRSLRPGHTPLITRLARIAHPDMPAPIVAYTRQVNWAWTIYFATMTGLSLALFFFAPPLWWSVLANFLTLPAAVLMFVIEYVIRLQRFPDFEHASLLDGIRLFSRHR